MVGQMGMNTCIIRYVIKAVIGVLPIFRHFSTIKNLTSTCTSRMFFDYLPFFEGPIETCFLAVVWTPLL